MKRLLGSLAAAVSCLVLVAPAAAGADTAFGGDPTQAVTPTTNCEGFSCTLFWNNPAVGSDVVPIPATGGSGTVTSVTLPAMTNPGQMQAVVLTNALAAGSEPGHPDYICCQVKAVSPTFTVPPNQITTVPLNLHVSATETVNLNVPGDTAFGDNMAISVLTPNASIPVRTTGNAVGFDGLFVWYPALTAPNGEFVGPTLDPVGFQLLARFTLALDGPAPPPAPTPGPAPTPTPAPAAAGGGLKLNKGALPLGADGKTIVLGDATNPPTAGTTQTLTLPANARALASAKPKKPVVLGRGTTTIPAGKTRPLKLTLNGEAKGRLKANGKLTATLTVVAVNARGEKQTVTRQVTIKAPVKKRR